MWELFSFEQEKKRCKNFDMSLLLTHKYGQLRN